jgi:hypothetical protein
MVEKIQVKLLELEDEKLEALALARIFGLIPASSIIDSLAHSAPAASAAKKQTPTSSTEFLYELNQEEIELMESIIAIILSDIDGYRAKQKASQ